MDLGSIFHFFLTLRDMHFIQLYCHSPEGNTVAALGDRAFYTIYPHSLDGDTAATLADYALCEHRFSCFLKASQRASGPCCGTL